MNLEELRASLSASNPPAGLPVSVEALWQDGRGDWDAAHNLVQQHEDQRDCNQVHAYLHRKEGDLANAGYWYRRVGSPVYAGSLEEEWAELVTTLLKNAPTRA
ncbi:MAG TPA: hypothetical protein VH186_21710 [Chloroflexia bacterium]|nr:hypothetical protein [Chloroflexia bacterium]